MKRIIFALIFLFVQVSLIHSQWVMQNSGVWDNLNNVFFVNDNTGFVSFANRLLKTTDGGTNWFTVKTFIPQYFISTVYFINENTGWAGIVLTQKPPFAYIYITHDGGVNWTTQTNIVSSYISDIKFFDASTGFAFGQVRPATSLVAKTTNGGSNWTLTYPLGDYKSIMKASFIDVNTGWVCTNDFSYGNSYIYRTINSGISWVQMYPTAFSYLQSIYFINSNTGWIGGYTGINKTTNGGTNWVIQYNNGDSVTSIKFLNDTFGWAIGLSGRIKYTYNSGTNWQNYSSITNSNLNSIFFPSYNKGWIAGSNGVILHTDNNGGINSIEKYSNFIPLKFSLHQNYPNPFNPVTKIKFDLPKSSNAKLIIYDLLGREVTTLVNEQLKPGSYEAEWDGTNFASGIYFYSLVTDDFTETKKMVLIK